MKPKSFIHGAIIGLVISAISTGCYQTLRMTLDPYSACAVAITLATLLYLVFLFADKSARQDSKKGRVTLLFSFIAFSTVALLISPPITAIAILNLFWVWLARSFYRHKYILSAAADLALCTFSLFASVAAGVYSQSVFLAFWSFFLTQAMIIPSLEYCRRRFERGGTLPLRESFVSGSLTASPHNEGAFKQAHLAAEQALDRLTSR